MFGEFDFQLLQMQYFKAAMDQLAALRPQAMTPAQRQTAISVKAPGIFHNKVAGHNSKGDGPESAVSTVVVA